MCLKISALPICFVSSQSIPIQNASLSRSSTSTRRLLLGFGSPMNVAISSCNSSSLALLRATPAARRSDASLHLILPCRSLAFSLADFPPLGSALGQSIGKYGLKFGSSECPTSAFRRLYLPSPRRGSPFAQVAAGSLLSVTGCSPLRSRVSWAFLPPEPSCAGGVPVHLPASPLARVSAKHPQVPHHRMLPDRIKEWFLPCPPPGTEAAVWRARPAHLLPLLP